MSVGRLSHHCFVLLAIVGSWHHMQLWIYGIKSNQMGWARQCSRLFRHWLLDGTIERTKTMLLQSQDRCQDIPQGHRPNARGQTPPNKHGNEPNPELYSFDAPTAIAEAYAVAIPTDPCLPY